MTDKAVTKPKAAKYEPTEHETSALEMVRSKEHQRPCAPFFKMKFNEAKRTLNVAYNHDDHVTAQVLVMNELGTGDARFYAGIVTQLAMLGENGKSVSDDASNFAMSVIRAVNPQNELETMLAAQMAAVHQATMTMARRLNHVETITQQDAAERALNKLARTFSMQMDTLKRFRATAQQTVRVERVTVNEGGQAIVGQVQTGGRGDDKK